MSAKVHESMIAESQITDIRGLAMSSKVLRTFWCLRKFSKVCE